MTMLQEKMRLTGVLYLWLLVLTASPITVAADNSQNGDTHENILLDNPAYVDRRLQGLVQQIGAELIEHTQQAALKDYDFLLLSDNAVNAFYTDSAYIYLNRGIMSLASHNGHIAAIMALKIASLEQPKQREPRLYRRAAELLDQANYDPAALVEILTLLYNHKLYVESSEAVVLDLGAPYPGLDGLKFDRAIKKLKQQIESLKKGENKVYPPVSRQAFLSAIEGLTYGETPSFSMTSDSSLIVDQQGTRTYFPNGWSAFKGEQAKQEFPFKLRALTTQYNDSFVVAHSSREQGLAVSLIALDKTLETKAEEFLKKYIQDLSKEMSIQSEYAFSGTSGIGYFIKARVLIQYYGKKKGLSINGANISNIHFYGVVPLADKTIVLNAVSKGFGSRYGSVDETVFLSIASNIRSLHDDKQSVRSLLPHYQLKSYTVKSGDSLASLTQNLDIEDAAHKVRILNGLAPDIELEAGQLIKLIEQVK